MIAASASLRPVSGSVPEIFALLKDWLRRRDALPLLVRSSGSTGEPKDVALSADAVRFSASASLERLGGPGQWVLALPAHHVAGLQVLTRSWASGTEPVVLDEHPDLRGAAAALTAPRRYLACVPTQLHRWLTSAAETEALRQLDGVLLGGAAAGEDLLATARESGVDVVTSYGMTETCGGCVYDGIPLDGVAVALGEKGEVRLSGPMLFDGYDGRPDLTADALRDGWLHSPDLGRFTADGRLEVLGRADDVVMSGGVSVPLGAVERRIAAWPGLDAAAVIAVPDQEWGSRVVAVVAGHSPPTFDDLRSFVSAVHPRSWAPRALVVQDALPLLSSGKVDKLGLARDLARTHPAKPSTRLTNGGRKAAVFSLPMNVRFRGVSHREGPG